MSTNSKNLSETLFSNHKPTKETSSLTQYLPSNQLYLESKMQPSEGAWYRTLRRMQWAWQGLNPVDTEEVLARIASSPHPRTVETWLDTVTGYRRGNWSYEWNRLGMQYQQESSHLESDRAADKLFLASLCHSIAGYPHLKNDSLAIQSQAMANASYADAAKLSSYVVKQLEFPYKNKKIIGHLHLSHTQRPHPVVIVSAGLDSLQTDMWRLFRDYLATLDIAMLTIDMPSIGYNSHWSLTEDTSVLHQAVLSQLSNLPWIDHHRVGLIGFRFGGNAMTRLSFIEPRKITACVTLGAPIHDILSSPEQLKKMPKMYLDVLASRLGKNVVDIDSMSRQLSAWSLKTQGFLGGRKTQTPILALGLEGDLVSPYSDNHLVALYSAEGLAKEIKSRTLLQGYEQALGLAINWLENKLIK